MNEEKAKIEPKAIDVYIDMTKKEYNATLTTHENIIYILREAKNVKHEILEELEKIFIEEARATTNNPEKNDYYKNGIRFAIKTIQDKLKGD